MYVVELTVNFRERNDVETIKMLYMIFMATVEVVVTIEPDRT